MYWLYKSSATLFTSGTLLNIYYGLVKSHFDYCRVLWASCGKELSGKLQKLQTLAARVLASSNYDADVPQLLKKVNWDNLEPRFQILKARNSL